MNFFGMTFDREIRRVQAAHALTSVVLSFVNIYIPAFLLTHGFTLSGTILFFVVFHAVGLPVGLLFCPWSMRRFGLVPTLRFSYPLQIAGLILLNLMPAFPIPWVLVAAIGGSATFAYWMPLNILLVRYADSEKMGSDLGIFFALPKVFGIVGPLLSALLIPFFGFWPMFAVACVGLIFAYLPLAGIPHDGISVDLDLRRAWGELRKRKLLFFLEGLDNIIEESEWFWGIFVFLIIGSLSVPGIVGGLESLGGALFAVLVGKRADRNAEKMVPYASVGLMIVWVTRFFVHEPVLAYSISFAASFVMTFFLVSYFGMIYRKIKGDNEEEFLILREIPTVLGRMVMFGVVMLTVSDPRRMFVLPIATIAILIAILFIRRNRFKSVSDVTA
ncbi:MAG: MFS transporter [Candidatus Moranbacteria bacterium]|nr:MFS transporter [Candidatus Moranbacteria bacterium]